MVLWALVPPSPLGFREAEGLISLSRGLRMGVWESGDPGSPGMMPWPQKPPLPARVMPPALLMIAPGTPVFIGAGSCIHITYMLVGAAVMGFSSLQQAFTAQIMIEQPVTSHGSDATTKQILILIFPVFRACVP